MSNPKAREIMASYIADYAGRQTNVDFLHIWLADAPNNHCECEECAKKVSTDWYVMLLNDIDRHLTARNLRTRIVFIVYYDTLWAPITEKLQSSDRFTLLFAPITRKYSETYRLPAKRESVTPFVCNHNRLPNGMEETLGYLSAWQETWDGDCFCYEYHFWIPQYCDLGGLNFARLLYDDIQGLADHNLSGIVEDGSQRSFWPNGFLFYVYCRTLYDKHIPYETLLKEYYSSAYGDDWETVHAYMQSISDAADFAYVKGECSADTTKGAHYNPAMLPSLQKLTPIVDAFLPYIEGKLDAYRQNNNCKRVEYIHWYLLRRHADYVKMCADVLCCACVGDTDGACRAFEKLPAAMADLTHLCPDVYDHDLCMTVVNQWLR